MAQTQMALDSLDFDATVALATKVAPHVDILEIGTPCIKHNGIELLKTLRAKFPNNKILVDLKTMDAGFYEAEPFYKAGADICTVLGTADIGTIKGVIDVANKYGKMAQVDLINVTDKKARTLEVAKLGAHIIGVHTGLDQQAAGQTPFADLALVTSLNTGAKVSVAGGVKAATVRQVVDAGADIVVAGAAIYGAADPAASAAEITGLARGNTASAGGGMGKYLPWALIAGAVLLGLYFLTGGKKAEEMPVTDGTAVEQTAPAADAAAPAADATAAPAADATVAPAADATAAPAADTAAPATDTTAAPAANAMDKAKEMAAPAADAAKDAVAVPATTDGLVGAAKDATGTAK
ncbi:MAG: 3-hexulose-6-phosphate synthase [Bdellovibrio sp.]|nr:3-hexulose-6-phosphate synthase [Methylotenera sp.]